MLILLLGIVIFLGCHTFTTLRPARQALIARVGEGPYKGLYSLVAGLGFVLICWGFGRYRAEGWVQIWEPPSWTRHITMLLMWFAFIALAASGPVPGRIRGWLRHPMLVGVKIWALAHLLANGDLGGMVLFGSFLAWAVYDRIAVKRRGDMGAMRLSGFTTADAVAVGGGTVAYVAMIFLHPVLIGVSVLSP
jgi:uncharacterized membrane protein